LGYNFGTTDFYAKGTLDPSSGTSITPITPLSHAKIEKSRNCGHFSTNKAYLRPLGPARPIFPPMWGKVKKTKVEKV
jgi:hypothetical protein